MGDISKRDRRHRSPVIPKDARWYLAEQVVVFQIEEENGRLVHVNLILVNAGNPDEAYDKALAFGASNDGEWQNDEGKQVVAKFRGLRNLHVIYEDLEDGAEVLFEEYKGVSEAEVGKLVRPKERLNVFSNGPRG